MTTPTMSSDKAPRVAVVMTTFNRGELVRQAVDSVLTQSCPHFELIVVDDGSAHETRATLRVYAERDSRVRVIEQDNAGPAAAANRGVRESSAPLIARLDSDDFADPERLSRQLAFMEAHPDVACSGTFVELIDGQGRFLTTEQKPLDDEAIQEDLLQGHCAISHTSCIFRRDAFEQIGGYDESYRSALDVDLFLRLGEVGRLANLNESLSSYRLHDNSISGRRAEQQLANVRRACESAWRRRGESRPFKEDGAWRPTDEAESRLMYTLRYGWWANRSGEFETAASYAWDAIKLRLVNREAWALFVLSVLKRKPAAYTQPAGVEVAA